MYQCCAISFIETLTHESLSMPQTEFNALMSGQIAIHSVWESALMSCEMMHMLDENCKTMTTLEKRNAETLDGTQQLDKDINEFRENLTKNLETVLQRTQFELKEIKTLQSLRSSLLPQSITHRMSIDKTNQPHQIHLTSNSSSNSSGHFKSNLVSSMASINLKSKESSFPFALEPEQSQLKVLPTASNDHKSDLLSEPVITEIDSFAGVNVLIPSVSDPMTSSPSVDYLSVSPGFGPCSLSFDYQSFDETTPDEFAPINFLKGITNINYDYTFSDNSAENSISEEVADPQSRATADDSSNQIKPSDSMSSINLDEFDPLRNTTTSQIKPTNINLNDPKPTTLIESEDSPNQVYLPSPLKPTATDYKGFSNSNIPSISCNTGDFSSLNHSNDTQS